jgi:ribose transport system permease protein
MRKEFLANKVEKRQSPALFFILFIVVLTVIAVAIHFLTDGMFLEARNAQVILSNSIYPTFIAWGLCFLFACDYTDLSIGSVVILGSFAACAFGNLYGYPGVIFGGLVTSALLLFVNFTIFAFTKMPSWIASISLAIIYEAAAIFLRTYSVTKPYVDTELSRNFRALGQFPVNVILLVVFLIVVYFLYNRTTVGMNIRAIGGNKAVSRVLGVNIIRTLLWVGLICGLLIGVASVIQQSYNAKTFAMSGMTSIVMLFKPLAIALLAQILQKWIDIIIAVPFCSLIIYAVFNLMTFFGVPSGTLQDVFLGVFLIAFGIGGQKRVKEVVK